jgi:hypothetical protein
MKEDSSQGNQVKRSDITCLFIASGTSKIISIRAQNNDETRIPLFHKGFGLKYNNLNPNELKVINAWIHH